MASFLDLPEEVAYLVLNMVASPELAKPVPRKRTDPPSLFGRPNRGTVERYAKSVLAGQKAPPAVPLRRVREFADATVLRCHEPEMDAAHSHASRVLSGAMAASKSFNELVAKWAEHVLMTARVEGSVAEKAGRLFAACPSNSVGGAPSAAELAATGAVRDTTRVALGVMRALCETGDQGAVEKFGVTRVYMTPPSSGARASPVPWDSLRDLREPELPYAELSCLSASSRNVILFPVRMTILRARQGNWWTPGVSNAERLARWLGRRPGIFQENADAAVAVLCLLLRRDLARRASDVCRAALPEWPSASPREPPREVLSRALRATMDEFGEGEADRVQVDLRRATKPGMKRPSFGDDDGLWRMEKGSSRVPEGLCPNDLTAVTMYADLPGGDGRMRHGTVHVRWPQEGPKARTEASLYAAARLSAMPLLRAR